MPRANRARLRPQERGQHAGRQRVQRDAVVEPRGADGRVVPGRDDGGDYARIG